MEAGTRRRGVDEAPVAEERLPFIPKLTLILFLAQVYFSVGSLSLSPARVLFLVLVPITLINLLRGVYGRFHLVDGLILAYVAWMSLAIFMTHPASEAVQFVGSNALLLLGGYLTARALIRSHAEFIGMIRFLVFLVLFSLPFATYEAITRTALAPLLLEMIPNVTANNDINHEPRLGLSRAQFTFAHPIHYGLFCAMIFSLVFIGLANSMGNFRRLASSALVALCCFLSLSSGPVLALACQIGLIVWAKVTTGTKSPWRLLTILLSIAYVIIELASNRPGIYAVVERLSFNSQTAFVRRVLFEYGMRQIEKTPIFGVGAHPWDLPYWMTGSIDNFWLALAVVYGVPAFIFLAGAFLISFIRIGKRDFAGNTVLLDLRRGWIFSMIGVILTLATVAVWAEMSSIVLFLLGSGQWMTTVTQNAAAQSPSAPTRSFSRFRPLYGEQRSHGQLTRKI